MPIHFSLDFTAPFEVGDQVYTQSPYNDKSTPGNSPNQPGIQATVASAKLVLSEDPAGSTTVTELVNQKTIQVDRIIYTLIPDDDTFSAFTVAWLTGESSQPQLFASQQEWLRSQQDQKNDSGQ